MRQPRFLSPSAADDVCLYHSISRVVDRRFGLGCEEKDTFVRMMRQYEAFCGVRVFSYCIMSNHFHILVEVPPKKKGGGRGTLWEGRFKSVHVEDGYAALVISAYIDLKPVRAGVMPGRCEASGGAGNRRLYSMRQLLKERIE